MPSLQIQDLVVSFEGLRAIDRLTLSIPETGIIGLIGPNGAGKTTLVDVVSGFLRPDAGSCKYGSHDLTKLRPEQIARNGVSRTFQNLRLIRQVSVTENLLLAYPEQAGECLLDALLLRHQQQDLQLFGESLDILKEFELASLSDQLAGQLSYGQQKLLSLACAFATGARLLLLDEPVAGIHPDLKDFIIGRLRDFSVDNAIIMIEHDLDAIREAAHRVVVLDQGNVVADGETHKVLNLPEVLEAYVG